ncbi:MAG: hypothetical protein LBT08_03765 [Synergistaceae bacterium]|jgi:hypothetical protein|nr:hypothetical protein [Synergistaceae bacterium]
MRPIEANMSVYNVDYKAGQVKDPSSHHVLAGQQDEIVKKAQQQVETVQPMEKSEGEVKIRERKDDREKDGGRGKKKGSSRGRDEETEDKDVKSAALKSGLDFLA